MKKLIVFVILAFWPLNLLLTSGKQDFSFKALTETIFLKDYQAEQRILEEINLYPSVFLARVYQNKARIYQEKWSNNLFALIDLNNYFFGFHPQEIIGNQNLKKFPFVSIIFFITGLSYFNLLRHKKVILLLFLPSLIYLSLLANFDRIDFILWLPMSLLILGGIDILSKKNYWKFIVIIFWVFTLPQITRVLSGYQ